MKKWITLILGAALVLSLAACGKQEKTTPSTETQGLGGQVQIANPFRDCSTLAEAQSVAGFDITLPEAAPEWATDTAIRAMEGNMLEVIYSSDTDKLSIRKSSDSEDPSGNYGHFEEISEMEVAGLRVTTKGNSGKIFVAVWTDGDYAFSIDSATGLSQDDLTAMISAIQ